MIEFYTLGYEAGALDKDPDEQRIVASESQRIEYLNGWVLGQAIRARWVRYGVAVPATPPPLVRHG